MAKADGIEIELLMTRMTAVADEMAVALIQGAYSTAAKESADASTALFDATGRLLVQSSSTLALHAASLRECVRSVIDDFRQEPRGFANGDIYIMNDPYRGGIHSNDLAVFAPLVADGGLRYLAGAIVHVADLGSASAGGLPSQARDVFQEGLLLPPTLLRDAGHDCEPVWRLLGLNSRTPEKVRGDVRALMAAATVGVNGLTAVLESVGSPFTTLLDGLIEYTEERVRSGIAEMPLGEWTSEFTADDDGIDLDLTPTVRVKVTHAEPGRLIVDLTASDSQTIGPINSAYSQSLSAIIIGVRCFLAADIPMNEGLFRAIECVMPGTGSIVNPAKPAPMNARVVIVTAIIEAILDILGQVRPGKLVAGSDMLHIYTLSSAAEAETWVFMDIDFGGTGAKVGADGVDASGPYFFGGRGLTVQLEALEREYPIRFLGYGFVADSGGPGEWRGGAGVRREWELLSDASITVRADRIRRPPRGRDGGLAGRPGGWLLATDGVERSLAPKQMLIDLRAGARFAMLTTGGGGVGTPWDRDPVAVARDVRYGAVSRDGAFDDYGVVLSPAGDVDEARTLERRSSSHEGAKRDGE